jgi:hypothetical protein
MISTSRAKVASSFTVIKGAMIEETYSIFSGWNFERSKRQNLDRLRQENFIGAKSATWLRDVAKVLNRRFDPAGRDRSLVVLAQHGLPVAEWRPLLLWHMTRDEFLVRDFFESWLFDAYDTGTFRIRREDVEEYLVSIDKRGATTEHAWSDQTKKRVAAGLLKIAVDFGILSGTIAKEFASFHLPERSFLYLLHAMRSEKLSPSKVLASRDWRLFIMRPIDVERELLRLHQFRKLEYHVAGSLVQLDLPCTSSYAYTQRGWLHERSRTPPKARSRAHSRDPDPRTRISAYHDMPYALFRYDPEDEFNLRKQVTLLETRLSQKGKHIKRISLAECLDEAMRSQRPLEEWFAAEREQGVETVVETVHSVLSEYKPLVELVAERMPDRPRSACATSSSSCERARCSRSTGRSRCSSS